MSDLLRFGRGGAGASGHFIGRRSGAWSLPRDAVCEEPYDPFAFPQTQADQCDAGTGERQMPPIAAGRSGREAANRTRGNQKH